MRVNSKQMVCFNLHRVLSALLDGNKSWFALNYVLCGDKPSRFCCSGSLCYFLMNTIK